MKEKGRQNEEREKKREQRRERHGMRAEGGKRRDKETGKIGGFPAGGTGKNRRIPSRGDKETKKISGFPAGETRKQGKLADFQLGRQGNKKNLHVDV